MGCEQEYDKSRIGEFENKLVVNSFFSSTHPWSVKVSSNGNRFDNTVNIEAIENATVEIYDGNGKFLYELFHTKDGEYSRGDFAPSSGQEYTIRVESRNFPDVVATSNVPAKSKLMINEFLEVVQEDEEGVEVDFVIEDDSKIESFYLWEVVLLNDDFPILEENNQTDFSKDFLNDLESEDIDLKGGDVKIIGGQVFNNGTYSTQSSSFENRRRNGVIRVSKGKITGDILANQILKPNNVLPNSYTIDDFIHGVNLAEDNETNNGPEFKYELRVLSISKDLYNYYQSIDDYRKSGGTDSSIYTPYKFKSNVHNGLGVFAGFSESYIRF